MTIGFLQNFVLGNISYSWTTQSRKQTLVLLSTALLKKGFPVLILGEKFAEEVLQEIVQTVHTSMDTTKLYNYELHALSSVDSIINDLFDKMQVRGKSILVPKDVREIIVCFSDLSTTINEQKNVVSSFIKDLAEYKQLFHDNQGYHVQDTTILSKLSMKDELYKDRRI